MVNEWTSNDVPSVESLDLYNKRPDLDISGKIVGAAVAFGAMVKHLNTHHPKPDDDDEGDTFPVRLRRQANTIAELQSVVNRWRRAHSIVEQERDQARRERDEWKARADKWHGAWQKSAPARTVTREDVEKVVHGSGGGFFDSRLDAITDAVCALFGIEAGQATDPLLDKAQEFAALADWELSDREAGLLHTVAAHVLGQGDRHVDQ